ncbi:class I SAM-dependent methyltransferase [Nocardia sp. NPDC049707]|uniref:class I SAM-dependent methyltransferase n=1 Tax=Nocardia sp. NPDC049707 TaxID=3154735 RepID=UPI0034285C8D
MRTEGDSWDINTSVGSTAMFVAAARALAGRQPGALAVDPLAEVFVRAAGGEWVALLDGELPGHPLSQPGFGQDFQQHQLARTKYFDDYFRAATAAGLRQVVILAAGLDARAYRLSWPDGTVLFELDRPQVLEFKRETLSAHGDKPRADRREVPVDLRADWPAALRAHGFDPARPTAWLAEGLLIYLTADAQDRLFETIDSLSASGSWAAVEQLDQLPAEAVAAMTERSDNNARTEWFSLIYNDPRTDTAEWFAAHGWTADRIELRDYLRAHGRPASSVDPNEGPSGLTSLVTAVRP